MPTKDPIELTDVQEQLEVVIGIFDTHQDAHRVAAFLRGQDQKVQEVSRSTPAAANQMPKIIYDDVKETGTDRVVNGAESGGAIGSGSGLLLMVVPALELAVPIATKLAGVWIGGPAEANKLERAIEFPNQENYRKKLAAGKSFVVLVGDEHNQDSIQSQLKELGATATFQHPFLAYNNQ